MSLSVLAHEHGVFGLYRGDEQVGWIDGRAVALTGFENNTEAELAAQAAFDSVRRWLARDGAEVTLVRNVTDIDDKILAKAEANGVPWWAWAYDNERACTRAYDVLGVLPPTYEPRATGHIPEMVVLMERLIERGVVSQAYFDRAFKFAFVRNPFDRLVSLGAAPVKAPERSIPSMPMPNFEPKPPPMCSTLEVTALWASPSSFAASAGSMAISSASAWGIAASTSVSGARRPSH